MIRCRTCHYDLRGQTVLRCPECGTPFDPDDPLTYEGDQAGTLARVLDWFAEGLTRGVWVVGFVLAVYLFVVWTLGPHLYWDGVRFVDIRIGFTLRVLVREWEIQKQEDPDLVEFDIELAKSRLATGRDKSYLIRSRHNVLRRYYAKWAVSPSLLVVIVLAVAHRKRAPARARMLWVAVPVLAATLSVLALLVGWPEPNGDGYSYMDDFVFLAEPCPVESMNGLSIIAYEKTPFPTGHQYVAFSDGTVKHYRSANVREMLRCGVDDAFDSQENLESGNSE